MTRKQKRLAFIGGIGAVLMGAVLLVMFALRDE
ncbi:MAG: cytochrome c biogenesis protein CcmE, partial [Pseudomonadota bacterium]|nr:cytochrome c biogenesis protein CcmE [Pseudomonadota bacterium]